MNRDTGGRRTPRRDLAKVQEGHECIENQDWGELGLVRSAQVWDIWNEELSGFVTEWVLGVKTESKLATRMWA